MAIKNSCFLLLFFLFTTIIHSQRLPFRNYLEKSGLPSSVVRYIFQDSRGYLWIGTGNGLSIFDGIEFKNFNKDDGLADSKINTIIEDRRGNVWIGTVRGGISCFSIGEYGNYLIRNRFPECCVYSIVEDEEGKLWFGTSKGIRCLDGETIRQFTTPDGLQVLSIFDIITETNRNLWLGTDNGLYYFEKENLASPHTIYTLKDGLLDNLVKVLLVDSGGNLWIGTEKGLNRFKAGKCLSYTKKEGLIGNSVTTIMEDHNHNIWIGTMNGVSLFSGEKFTSYTTINGLPNNFIYSITEDREGNIWFSTHGGASCLTSLNIKMFTREEGLPNEMVTDIIQDKEGRYWISTSEGLSCYEGRNFKIYTERDGLISSAVNGLMEDHKGNIWIATLEGLSIFSSGKITSLRKEEVLANNCLFYLEESRDGSTWIGSGRGLIHFMNGKFSLIPFKMKHKEIIRIIESRHGDLWFSSSTRLYRYSKNRITDLTDLFARPGNDVYARAIFEDSKGRIWIGTESGLSFFYKGKVTHYFTKNSSLLDNTCYCILEDNRGRLWIGHPKGLSCFDGKEFKTYTSERMGLTKGTWFRGIKDNGGSLWFATSGGVVTFDPPPLELNTVLPLVNITGVKAMEKDIPLHGNNRFDYDQNAFRFDFVGCSFGPPPGARYKYMLENIDQEWRFTKDRSLFYPFLPPGTYNFKVKAINNDGIESETPAEYRFKILPPFWQTWWFLVIMGLVIILLVILVLHWRVKRIGEKAEMRARKAELEARNRQLIMSQRMELMAALAAGNVHDLKNLMAVIIAYSRVMSKKYQDDQEDYKNIEIIKETAATAVQMAKQILSFARPKTPAPNETVDLGQELTEIIATLKITQPKNIHILWEPPPEPILFPIHPARFQQVVMNLCLNACQAMPNGGELRIGLSHESHDNGNAITLGITDTGPGIQEEHLPKLFEPMFTTKEPGKGTGLGLFVVKQIVDEYHGTINVSSMPGKGAAFIIRFPLPKNKEEAAESKEE